MKQMAPERTILLVIIIAVALNAFIFCLAFPAAFQSAPSATFAKDFSAYYVGGWRLLHNPSQIYCGGVEPGDPLMTPKPQTFKYTPSFLVIFAPFMTLSYNDALAAFDILQIMLIPALAFFVYRLVKGKNLILGIITTVMVLVEPLSAPSISYTATSFLHIRVAILNTQSLAPSYYCGYLLGNAHILQTVLLVGALYFGYIKKPWLSALLFAFCVFDPRGAILALPLLIWFNRHLILKFAAGTAAFVSATNLPFFFYHGIGFAFLNNEMNRNIASQMYAYDWIPVYSIAALTMMEIITVASNQSIHFSFPLTPKVKNTEPARSQ